MASFQGKVKIYRFLIPAIIVSLLIGCLKYHPKPVDPEKTMNDFESKRLNSEELKQIFLKVNNLDKWPPSEWDFKMLTIAALIYNPEMDVSRAQWMEANAERDSASERLNPSITTSMGYNSSTPTRLMTRWIPEVVLDIPVQTAGKRRIKRDQSSHLLESARLNVFKTAFDIRSSLRDGLLQLYYAKEKEELLKEAESIQDDAVNLMQTSLDAGEVSLYDLVEARATLHNLSLARIESVREKDDAISKIAQAIGVSKKAVEEITISLDCFKENIPDFSARDVRRNAALNRFDILSSLSEYAASESAFQLEIAKQYPDIHIGPGYQLDQTDDKWTIGLTFELPIMNRNRGMIKEAEAKRKEYEYRFLSLQAKVINEVDSAISEYDSAKVKFNESLKIEKEIEAKLKMALANYNEGEISLYDLTLARLELLNQKLSSLDSFVQLQEVYGKIEDAQQCPVDFQEVIIFKGEKNE